MSQDLFKKDQKRIEAAIKLFPKKAVVIARKHFDESFTNSGFTDTSLKKWKAVKDRRKGRSGNKAKPLVSSGRLRASIRTEVKDGIGIVFTQVPYAGIHNNGSTVTVKGHSRTHSKTGTTSKVKSHSRTVDQRQFMGPSKAMEDKIEKMMLDDLDKIFNL